MKYYIDGNGKLYEKSGIDYRVKNKLQDLEGLKVATAKQVDEVLNPTPTVAQLKWQAKFTRDDAIKNYRGSIEFNGLLFDTSHSALDSICRTIRACENRASKNRASKNSGTELNHNWRLADNSTVEITTSDLIEIKKLIEIDLDNYFVIVWNEFIAWSAGSMTDHFNISECE